MAENKDSKLDEILTNPESIVEDIQSGKLLEFYEKYKNIINIVAGSIAGIVIGIFGFRYYVNTQNEEAQNTMFQAVYYFEADSLSKALNGDGANPGFVEITESYPFTKAANMANFYAGTCYLKLGKYEDAIDYLKNFGASDLLIQARAYSLIGDAYLEQNDYENAVTYYQKASDYKPTKEFTPEYLMKLGLACELNNNYESAVKAYDRIINEFPNSNKVNDARKYKAMNEVKLSSL
ncbi:MAG: tetratricopeptide repeat protein [Cytophagales bacterium]|nr:tetratricopeptide repeat protein [Cytophagales bacterium]